METAGATPLIFRRACPPFSHSMQGPNTMTLPVIVIDLPFLAHEINDAQRQIEYYGKSMLLEAKRAGEALINAKEQVRHGEFKAWVKAHCRVSYDTAADYMKIARHFDKLGTPNFSGASIRQALAEIEGPAKVKAPKVTFTREDAEYVQKINGLATRGVDGEKAVAQAKLDALAKTHGMTTEQMIAKADELNPQQHMTPHDINLDRLKKEMLAPFIGMVKGDLLEFIFQAALARDEAEKRLKQQHAAEVNQLKQEITLLKARKR